jgi:hypothetical protein
MEALAIGFEGVNELARSATSPARHRAKGGYGGSKQLSALLKDRRQTRFAQIKDQNSLPPRGVVAGAG